jgi:hypothetical protein
MNSNKIDWASYYLSQAGGDYNYYRGSRFQEGYGGIGDFNKQSGAGLGGLFRKFASWIIPIVKKYAIPTIKSGALAVGREALDSASNVAKDVLKGENFQNSLNSRFNKSVDNLKDLADKSLEGKGIKRPKTLKNVIILKKQKKNQPPRFKDIFT